MAKLFTGRRNMQDVIDLAVGEFLDRLRATPGFADALDAAEANQQRLSGLAPLHPPHG